MEDFQLIQNYLALEHIKKHLYSELMEIVDYTKFNYSIDFINSEFYTIDAELNAKEYIPSFHYLIEGNENSKEEFYSKQALKVTSMLRPKRSDVKSYLNILSLMDCKKVFFQPFYVGGSTSLSLFKPAEGGGIIVRIGDVKPSDITNIIDIT